MMSEDFFAHYNIPEITGAIEGVMAHLASLDDRPSGYPFSSVRIYCADSGRDLHYFLSAYFPEVEVLSAQSLEAMRRLDFKKAGKVFGAQVQQMKDDLDSVPDEYIIYADKIPATDEFNRKTTGCRKYMVEVERGECAERWRAILFKKAVKKYVTEDIGLHITPPIWGDKYPDENQEVCPRVWCYFVDGKERVFQALEKWGVSEFADTPIRLKLPTRQQLFNRTWNPVGVEASVMGCSLVINWDAYESMQAFTPNTEDK